MSKPAGERPKPGIGWNTVAAVGFVESAYGTFGGDGLNAAGQASGPLWAGASMGPDSPLSPTRTRVPWMAMPAGITP
jgi:hypothetical protein